MQEKERFKYLFFLKTLQRNTSVLETSRDWSQKTRKARIHASAFSDVLFLFMPSFLNRKFLMKIDSVMLQNTSTFVVKTKISNVTHTNRGFFLNIFEINTLTHKLKKALELFFSGKE